MLKSVRSSRSWCCKRYILAKKLLRYREDFIANMEEPFGEPIELEAALDKCWDILKRHFEPTETGLSKKTDRAILELTTNQKKR